MSIKQKLFAICIVSSVLVICLCDVSFATEADIVSKIVAKFKQKTDSWEVTFRKAAQQLFMLCLTLEVCWIGIQIALNRNDVAEAIKQFVMSLLAASFFLAVINNYKEWSWNIINGLLAVSQSVVPSEQSSEKTFQVGLSIIEKIITVTANIDWTEIGTLLAFWISAIVILVCFALITAQVVMVKCEAMVAMMAALILLGLGGTSFMRDYAKNTLRYVLSVAFKLFVMYLVLGVGMSFILEFQAEDNAQISDILVILGASIVVLALVKSLPDVVAGIINGSHVGGGTTLMAAAAGVGGAMLGAAMSTGKGVQNIKDAANVAGMEGKTGFGRLSGTAGHLAGAGMDALQGKGRGTMADALERRMEHAKESKITESMNS